MACMRIVVALAGLGLACSPSSAPQGGEDASVVNDAGVGCLFCFDGTDDAPVEVQVKGKIGQICANPDGCHGAGAGGMGLSVDPFGAMINVTSTENPPMKRVLPGDPAQSYVFIKLACEGGIVEGGCMPPSSGPTDPHLVELFHDWIEAGAPTD